MKTMAIGICCAFAFLSYEQTPAANNGLRFKSEPMPDWNARFEQKQGWIGGDGAYSVGLKPDRVVWLFSDTWIGKIQDGKRIDATIVNNTLAIQTGRDAKASLEFIVRRNDQQKAEAFITPKNGRGWYWLFSGAAIDDHLLMFLAQIEKTNDPGVFGFRQIDQWLGVVKNPHDHPLKWDIEQRPVPFVSFTPERNTTFGAATLIADGFLYIYGTDEDISAKNRSRHLIVARVPVAQADNFDAWRFFANGEWVKDHRQATRIAANMASEGSVSYLPVLKQYVLVYTDRGLSDKIMMRTAANPWGPWSEVTQVFTCPEMKTDKNLFTYAAKAHPMVSADDELIISYVVNSFDFWQVARDARLYWPRFVRVKFSTAK